MGALRTDYLGFVGCSHGRILMTLNFDVLYLTLKWCIFSLHTCTLGDAIDTRDSCRATLRYTGGCRAFQLIKFVGRWSFGSVRQHRSMMLLVHIPAQGWG